MKNAIVAAIVAALVSGFGAGAAVSYQSNAHERAQNARIAQLRVVVKQLYLDAQEAEFEADLEACGNDYECANGVQFNYYGSDQWPGWKAFTP